jgi:PAS domain S-box-containing protein
MQLNYFEDFHNTVLNAPIGMCLLDATTLIAEVVNDKFLEVAGKPKDTILGQFYWDAFSEARMYYEAALNEVVEKGTAYYADEVELMLIRHGREEKIFVTFVYAPVKSNEGKVSKVVVWVLENTQQVNERLKAEAARLAFQKERNSLQSFFMQAPAGICILSGPNLVYELVNRGYQQLLPGRKLFGRSIFDALPELVGTPLQQVLLNVYKTGEPFTINELLIPLALYEGGPTINRYFSFNYQARRDEDDNIDGILAFVYEVTTMVQAQQEQLTLNEELTVTNEESTAANEELYAANEQLLMIQADLQKETEERQKAIDRLHASEQNIRNMVRQAPVGMCIVKGSPLMVEEVNDFFLEIIGKNREAFKTVPYWVVNQEAASFYEPITDQIMATGETYYANEHEIMLIRHGKEEIVYVDFVYEPIRDLAGEVEAIMIAAIDVSDKVRDRKTIENNVAEFQSLNEELAAVNEEYLATNEALSASNEELAAVNEELYASNEELTETQEFLRNSNLALGESESRLKSAFEVIARSEKLFKSIALNIPKSLIIVIDKDHRYITIEGELMSSMGYDRIDYQGKHPLEVGPPERYGALKDLYERLLTGETFSVEKKADTGENLILHFVPLKNEQGDVDAGLIITLDITEIKQAEEKSAKLAAIIESSDDAIISKTLDSVITSWNNSAQRMFGYTADEIIGQTIYTLIPTDRQEEEPRILSRLKRGERVEHYETKRVTKDGRELDVSLSISPIYDRQGNITGLSKIIRDITEHKQDETRKSDFIGMVSHELKTPLTSLTAIIQVANNKLKNSDDLFLAGAMEKANAQVKRMSTMINGFLNISRLESGKIHIEKQLFNIDQLLHEMVDETKITTSTHNIQFSLCDGVEIYADRDKISSVISNLLSNAVKYSPKGKVIILSCQITGNEVLIGVKYEGMGINPQDIDKVFDRYYRVETDNTRHISGFGIGLYLSAEIIKRHDGKIWVESENGEGSTFWFTLPIS